MFKQLSILAAFSALVIIFKSNLQMLFSWILIYYVQINLAIGKVLESGPIALNLRHLLAITLMPIVIAYPPTLLYRVVMKKPMPYFLHLLWLSWLVISLCLILSYHI